MSPNTAIFYDIENLIGPFTGKTNTILHLDEIYRRVLATEGVTGISSQRAYADWVLPLHRNLRNSVLQVGIEPVQIFNTNPYDKVKNAADVALIIDAVELLSKRPEITHYVIATGDGIFAFLAKKLHEYGKRVIGIGFDRIANMIFRNACDVYLTLEKTDKTLVATINAQNQVTQKLKPATPVEPTPSAPVKTVEKVPTKFPKTKYSDAIIAADVPIWRDLADASGTLMAIRGLIEALHTEETKELPDLEISVFMTYLNHYIPAFKVNRFGFSRFSNFMRFMLTGSPYTLYAAENNSTKISLREAVGEKGTVLDDIVGLQFVLPDATRYNSVFDVPKGSSFIHTITAADKTAKPKIEKPKAQPIAKATPKARVAKPTPAKTTPPKPEPTPVVIDEGSVRKWVKNHFLELSKNDKLSAAEARRMTTAEYSKTTFGVSTPIFREIETRSNLTEQRSVNGKVKYWKESFKFKNKVYIVFKEWVAGLHAERFAAWLATVNK